MSKYDLATLKQFRFERVLNEGGSVFALHVFIVVLYLTNCGYIDPITHVLTLLGKLPVAGTSESADAVVRIEKTALSADSAGDILTKSLENSKLIEGTDIVRQFP